MDKLTASDYVNRPIDWLVRQPDFSQHAFRIMARLMEATTEEIEALDLSHVKGAKNHAHH